MEFKLIDESGISRLWQHTQDNSTFVIIGSQDKDTRENRGKELYTYCYELLDKNITFKRLKGRYTYKDGTIGEEDSAIIYNIPKSTALELCNKLNQESIIWKDENFFGCINGKGEVEFEFTSNPKNMSFSDVEEFGSRLSNYTHRNKGKLFAFKLQEVKADNNSKEINRFTKPKTIEEDLFEWNF